MKVEKDKCDVCGKETSDCYAERGWIDLDINELTITNGRNKEGNASNEFRSSLRLDFCGKRCFNAYFVKLFKSSKETSV